MRVGVHVRGGRAATRRILRAHESDPERVERALRDGIGISVRPAPKRKADRKGWVYLRIEANV